MDEIKKITGKLVGWEHLYKREGKYKVYRDILVLDNKRVIEIYGKNDLNFDYMDEIEFFGRDCGDYFYVFSFKVLKKYIPPAPPIEPQKKLDEFESLAKKQESENNG